MPIIAPRINIWIHTIDSIYDFRDGTASEHGAYEPLTIAQWSGCECWIDIFDVFVAQLRTSLWPDRMNEDVEKGNRRTIWSIMQFRISHLPFNTKYIDRDRRYRIHLKAKKLTREFRIQNSDWMMYDDSFGGIFTFDCDATVFPFYYHWIDGISPRLHFLFLLRSHLSSFLSFQKEEP